MYQSGLSETFRLKVSNIIDIKNKLISKYSIPDMLTIALPPAIPATKRQIKIKNLDQTSRPPTSRPINRAIMEHPTLQPLHCTIRHIPEVQNIDPTKGTSQPLHTRPILPLRARLAHPVTALYKLCMRRSLLTDSARVPDGSVGRRVTVFVDSQTRVVRLFKHLVLLYLVRVGDGGGLTGGARLVACGEALEVGFGGVGGWGACVSARAAGRAAEEAAEGSGAGHCGYCLGVG